jgi:hypothetical protein
VQDWEKKEQDWEKKAGLKLVRAGQKGVRAGLEKDRTYRTGCRQRIKEVWHN